MAHAYLICGTVRGNAGMLAESLLQLLFCTGETPPCGVCTGCGQVVSRAHPDVLWLEPSSKSRQITVDEIRTLNHRIAQTSYAGGWKAGIISYADRLNNSAANAFLRTLEEPAGHTLLLLLTDSPQAVLPTIQSRCQHVQLVVEASTLPEAWRESLLVILREGTPESPLKVLEWAGRLDQILRDIKADFMEKEKGEHEDEDEEIRDARVQSKLKEVRVELFKHLLWWYRDLLLCTHGLAGEELYFEHEAPILKQLAEKTSSTRALDNLGNIEQIIRQSERNIPDLAVFEKGIMREFARV